MTGTVYSEDDNWPDDFRIAITKRHATHDFALVDLMRESIPGLIQTIEKAPEHSRCQPNT